MNIKTLIVVILLVALVGFGGVYLGTQIKNTTSISIPTPIPTEPLIGGDRDAHGCLPSAGYLWCEAKQKCLRPFEETCEALTPVPTVDEKVSLKTVIKDLLVAKHGNTANDLIVTVSEIQGNFAKGGAGGSGGGGMWFAVKTSNVWKLVWDGNGIITCEEVNPYPDLPVAWVPECYNASTQKMDKR